MGIPLTRGEATRVVGQATVPNPLLFRLANLYFGNVKAVLRYGKLYSNLQSIKL